MRNYKKYLAAVLAATMALGTSVTAFASTTLATPSVDASPSDVTDKDQAQGTLGGTGNVAGIVDKNVFHVVVPAIQDESTYYDFILDPQGLINKTNGVSFGAGVTYDDTQVRTLYFRNIPGDALAGSTYDYSNVSQGFQVTNKSTMDVDVTFTAELTNLNDGITLAEKEDFKDADGNVTTDTSIYMGIKKDAEAAVAVQDGGSTVSATLTKAPADAYKEGWTEDGGFVYELDPTATATFSDTIFKLTGASNSAGDWVAFKDATVAPKLEVTWKVVEHTTKPSIATTTYTRVSGQPLAITVNLGTAPDNATGIESITFVNPTGVTKTLAVGTDYTFAGTTLTINSNVVDGLTADRTYKVTFNDTAKTAVDITVKIS